MEEALPGNVTAGVVRVGDTVRRPAGPWTASVDALLGHLHAVGFRGAPRPLGRDDRGRQALEYVPGELGDPAGTYSLDELASIGAFLADLHRATASFTPPPGASWQTAIAPDGAELVCGSAAGAGRAARSPGPGHGRPADGGRPRRGAALGADPRRGRGVLAGHGRAAGRGGGPLEGRPGVTGQPRRVRPRYAAAAARLLHSSQQ